MPHVSKFTVKHGTYALLKEEVAAIFEDGNPDLTQFEKLLKEKLGGARLRCHNQKRPPKPNAPTEPEAPMKSEAPSKQNSTHWIIFDCECTKEFKVEYALPITEEGLTIVVTTPIQEQCKCLTLPSHPTQLRGKTRTGMKKLLTTIKASEARKQGFKEPAKAGDMTGVYSLAVLQKANSERRAEDDLDIDPVVDVMKRRRQKKLKNIAEVLSTDSKDGEIFRMILTTPELISLLEDWLLNDQPLKRLLLDATGGITVNVGEKPLLHHVLLAPMPKKDPINDEHYLVPVAEMVTDDGTGKNIAYFLNFVMKKLSPAARKRLHQIGTDAAYGNLHAILSLSDITITDYLVATFSVFKAPDKIDKADKKKVLAIVSPCYCYSHVTKNWKKDLERWYSDASTRRFIKACMAALTTIADAAVLEAYIKALLVLLGSRFEDSAYQEAHQKLAVLHGFADGDGEDIDEVDDVEIEEPLGEVIYKDSPYYQLFSQHAKNKLAEKKKSKKSLVSNKFYSDGFKDNFLQRYIALLPLWTVFVGRLIHKSVTRSNNARIESSFNVLKSAIRDKSHELGQIGTIKVGRYAAFRDSDMNCIVNEVRRDLPQKQTSQKHKPHKSSQRRRSNWTRYQDDAVTGPVSELSGVTEDWNKKREPRCNDIQKVQYRDLAKELREP